VNTLPAPPPRIARLPRDHAGRPVLLGSRHLGLPAQIVALASGGGTLPAVTTATRPNHEVPSGIGVALRAVGARPQFDGPGAPRRVHRLRDNFKVGNLDAVAVNTPTLCDMIDRHSSGNRADFPDPRLAVGISTTAEPSVSIRMDRPLPAQAAAPQVADRLRVVVPVLSSRGRTTKLAFIAARHRAVSAISALLENGGIARLAAKVYRLAKALQVGAGSGAAALFGRTFARIVGVEVGSAARALTRRIHPWHTPILVRRTAINPESTEGAQ